MCIYTYYVAMNPITPRCTCFALRRASRRASQIYDRELAHVDLSLNGYSILRRVREAKSLTQLADELGMDRTTVTRNLKPLLHAGLISEQRSRDDARKKWFAITAAGRRLLVRAEPHWQQAEDRIDALFGATKAHALRIDLAEFDQALRQAGDPA